MELFSKKYKIIPFILIFMTPLVSILYNVLKLVPEIKKMTAPYAPVFSLLYNLLWVIFTISLIKMMTQVWKNVHDSYQLTLAQKARDMLLVREKEVEQFQKNIAKRQEKIYKSLKQALADSEAGDYEAFEKRIAQLTEHIQTNRSETFCSNSLLNTILQIKKEKAEQAGVYCSFCIILPPKFSQVFSDITITSLFTNLLDNAIEACEGITDEKKFVELNTNYQANMFLIEMKNSKNSENIFTHKTTKKEDKKAHGHGLSIIEDIVKQQEGICNWEDEGTVFHSSLMLKFNFLKS